MEATFTPTGESPTTTTTTTTTPFLHLMVQSIHTILVAKSQKIIVDMVVEKNGHSLYDVTCWSLEGLKPEAEV